MFSPWNVIRKLNFPKHFWTGLLVTHDLRKEESMHPNSTSYCDNKAITQERNQHADALSIDFHSDWIDKHTDTSVILIEGPQQTQYLKSQKFGS